jgi:hypothetical protein
VTLPGAIAGRRGRRPGNAAVEGGGRQHMEERVTFPIPDRHARVWRLGRPEARQERQTVLAFYEVGIRNTDLDMAAPAKLLEGPI